MSHLASLKVKFKDPAAMDRAAKALGLVRHNKQTYRWYGRWMRDYHADNAAYRQGLDPKQFGKCAWCYGIPGSTSAYELGVVKDPGGDGYRLIWDFFGNAGRDLENAIGSDAHRFTQEYQLQVAEADARNQGYFTERTTLTNGDVQLTINVPGT